MTARDTNRLHRIALATGLGLTFSLTGAAYAQEAPAAEAPVGLFNEGDTPEGQDVAVDSLGQIDITVKDLEIAKVLQLLSIQSQRNIVTSRNVSGKVSADLYGVSFHEALDAILTPNGYGYEEKGNFIYVYTAQELEERRDAMRKTVTEMIRLNYISAEDAAAFLKPLLSANGSITATAKPDAGILPSESDAGANEFAHADTLLVRDYEENVAEILSVLSELDVRPQQVLVEATILQAQLTEANAFGVDFAVFADFDGLDFANPLNAVNELITGGGAGTTQGGGTAIGSTVGNTQAGNAGIKMGIVGSDAAVFLRALDSVTDTTVVSKPNILVLNRQRADLLVGQRLGYLSTTVTDTSETQTIEFLDVGTQLTVRPFITQEGTIRLELRPSVSDGTTRLEGGFIIPDQTTQELVTNVIVQSGQTVVLGGLFVEDTTVGRSQVPVLGDIPIIGAAFSGQDDNLQRTEVIFLVKTTIMENTDLAAIGRNAEERVLDSRIAIRKGLLPFSTDKLVSAHLLDARRHLDQGETGKAKWSVNLALYLSPTSEDAIALKEEIQGHPIGYHDRTFVGSMSDDVIDSRMDTMPMETTPTDESIMIERSLGATTPAPGTGTDLGTSPAASSGTSTGTDQNAKLNELKSTFVMPVVVPADNTSADKNSEEGAIVVDSVTELPVTAEASSETAEVGEGSDSGFDSGSMSEAEVSYTQPE